MDDVSQLPALTDDHRDGAITGNERAPEPQRTDDARAVHPQPPGTQAWEAPSAFMELPERLDLIPTHQLRVLCNTIFRGLDTDQPAREARERYDRVCDELERRRRAAELRGKPGGAREKFRDNVLSTRFELHRDGVMAAYLQYDLRGGEMRLLQTVVHPRFPRSELQPVLLQAVLLNVHRRRLAVVPCCPDAQRFLRDNPRFLSLIPAGQRRRYELLTAPPGATPSQEEHL